MLFLINNLIDFKFFDFRDLKFILREFTPLMFLSSGTFQTIILIINVQIVICFVRCEFLLLILLWKLKKYIGKHSRK